jgi:hypothetical protein
MKTNKQVVFALVAIVAVGGAFVFATFTGRTLEQPNGVDVAPTILKGRAAKQLDDPSRVITKRNPNRVSTLAMC